MDTRSLEHARPVGQSVSKTEVLLMMKKGYLLLPRLSDNNLPLGAHLMVHEVNGSENANSPHDYMITCS